MFRFGSRFVQDANPGNYSSFTIDNTATTNIPPSAPFSSHASLIIMEELNLDPDTEHVSPFFTAAAPVESRQQRALFSGRDQMPHPPAAEILRVV